MTVFMPCSERQPGSGKSTLIVGLARALTAHGWSVDHFREEEVLDRSAGAAVAGSCLPQPPTTCCTRHTR